MANITRQIWRYAPLGAAFAVLALGTAGMLLARETLAPAPDQTQAQVQEMCIRDRNWAICKAR